MEPKKPLKLVKLDSIPGGVPSTARGKGVLVSKPHVHGADCKHDHHDHGHEHGAECKHDHGHDHHDHHGHDHHGHDHHGHDHHDHDGHDHHDHAHSQRLIHPPGNRPAEGGGTALQLDLEGTLPGETDDVGRFEKLEAALESVSGVRDVHLRRDAGHAEVCIHYDPALIATAQLLVLAQKTGDAVAARYKQFTWFVRGMASADDATRIETAVGKLSGVLSASVAYASERLVIEYDSQTLKLAEVEAKAKALRITLEVPTAGHACSHHAHGGGLAPKLELPLVVASGALLLGGWLLEHFAVAPAPVPTVVWAVSMLCGGFFAFRGSVQSILQLRIDIETMMVVAAVGAAVLGAWFEGAFLLFLFSAGHAAEHRAMDRARRSIEALGELRPEVARLRRGGEVVEVPVGEVKRGERIVVRPGDRVPLDGVIREGKSSLEQAAITGESIPVAKGPGDEVFSGTINCEALLEVEVTKLATESVLARVVDMVAQAEAQKGPNQRFAQRLERTFAPLVMGAAILFPLVLWATGTPPKEAVLRAVALLVAASPCALAISTPSAVLSAVAAAARGGVLIKGGIYLELLAGIRVVAFDKTGTLTLGRPRLLTATPVAGAARAELLSSAAAVEALSSHPLARAVVEAAAAEKLEAPAGRDLEAVHGKGIRARVGDDAVEVGSAALFAGQELPAEVAAEVARLEQAGQTTMVVRRAGRWLGVLGVADTVRPVAPVVVRALREAGIARTVMLSGDNARVAQAIASHVGLDEARAPLMPEGKVAAVRELGGQGPVLMVGDGVNDAPALAAAAVGVGMGGAGSDAALETADVVLMSDDLSRLPFALGLSHAATAVMRQNLVIALGVSAVLVLAAVLGWTQISQAVVLHEGSTLLVVANGLRLLRYRGPGAAPAPAPPPTPAQPALG